MTPQDLREWRIKSGLSRAELAKRLQVSHRTVESWEIESRNRKIPDREASRIRDLMKQDVLKVPVTDEVRERLEKMAKERGLDPAQWAADLIKAALLLFAFGALAFHLQRSGPDFSIDAVAGTGKAIFASACGHLEL